MLNPYSMVAIATFAYILASDDNVAPFLVLQTKRLGLAARRAIWMAQNHPDAPWMRFAINRRAWRLAEELRKSYDEPKGTRQS
jgi:hypothetical protein